MQRPIYLSEYVWRYLLLAFNALSDESVRATMRNSGYQISDMQSREQLLEIIAENPSAFLASIDILNQPDLMLHMVLALRPEEKSDIELEYIFSPRAIQEMKNDNEFIVLDRLGGPEKDLAITKEGILKNMMRNCEIDFIEDRA